MRPGGSRWGAYHARGQVRRPRPLLLRACDFLGIGDGRMAVDLGCGSGADALALLERGWAVTAVDKDEAGLDLLRAGIPEASTGQITIAWAGFADVALPPADLVHAGFSLPFCAPGDPGMTFHRAEQVKELLNGAEVLHLKESEWDGEAASGQKHWDVFDVMFRRSPPVGA